MIQLDMKFIKPRGANMKKIKPILLYTLGILPNLSLIFIMYNLLNMHLLKIYIQLIMILLLLLLSSGSFLLINKYIKRNKKIKYTATILVLTLILGISSYASIVFYDIDKILQEIDNNNTTLIDVSFVSTTPLTLE